MKISIKNLKIEIDLFLIIYITISIFSLKARSFLMVYYTCYMFIIFHELSHIFVSSIFGYRVKSIKFSVSGVNIFLQEDLLRAKTSIFKKILVYSAGPLSNFLFAMLFKDIRMVYEINIFLGVLNFLPICPLDGYNLLYIITDKISNNNKFIVNVIQKCFLIIFILLGVIQIIIYKNISLIIFAMYIYLLNK